MAQRRGREYLAPWERAFDRVLSQLEELTHRQITGGIVLMLCAIDLTSLEDVATHPVTMGIGTGLLLGKLLGIAGLTWVSVKLGISRLPDGMHMKHLIGLGLLGGVGFTLSIFIAELGFAHHAEDLLMAKTGILFASLIAGLSGFIWLYLTSTGRKGTD